MTDSPDPLIVIVPPDGEGQPRLATRADIPVDPHFKMTPYQVITTGGFVAAEIYSARTARTPEDEITIQMLLSQHRFPE